MLYAARVRRSPHPIETAVAMVRGEIVGCRMPPSTHARYSCACRSATLLRFTSAARFLEVGRRADDEVAHRESSSDVLLEVPPRSATCGMPTAARRLWTQEHADSEVGGVSAQVMIRGPEGRGVVVHYCQGQITDPLCRCRVGINRYAPMHQCRTTTPPPLPQGERNLGSVACACTACVQTR